MKILDDRELAGTTHADHIQRAIQDLAPEVVRDGVVDTEALRQLFAPGEGVGRETFGMSWPGKADARLQALTPSSMTLRPRREKSLHWDDAENVVIEGDNLEALKLLAKGYHNRVKLIYIDPPYNTGKDFIYSDKYGTTRAAYLQDSGQVSEGGATTSSLEAGGRTHSRWLSMMMPRLTLARHLLRQDGVMFLSIDDREVAHLRMLCDEVFGAENFITNIVWQKKYSPQNDATYFSDMHDHILVYARNAKASRADMGGWNLDKLPRSEEQNKAYQNRDGDPRGPWKAGDLSVKTYAAANDYVITAPSGREIHPPKGTCWRVSQARLAELDQDRRIWWGTDGNNVPAIKRFLSELDDGVVPTTWWDYKSAGHNQEGRQELNRLLHDVGPVFDTPKPVRLLRRILDLATRTDPTAIVMDFFAGSGTLGHAVLEQNRDDGGKRRYILVQMAEPTGDEKHPTICDVMEERLRRALGATGETSPSSGFKVFAVDESAFAPWQPKHDELETSLLSNVDRIRGDRSEHDLLYETLVRLGLAVTIPIDVREFAGKSVYSAGAGSLIVCIPTAISREEIDEIARGIVSWVREDDPVGDTRVVFRDSAFADDVAKSNMTAILEQNGFDRGNIRSI